MNHTYKTVFNAALGLWQAVAETARAQGKTASVKRAHMTSIGLAATATLLTAAAQAAPALDPTTLPSGGQVVAGQAAIAQSGVQLTVTQTTDRAILEWNRFDIGSQASVRFDQPSASSVALNRVLSGDASRIEGTLSANGRVYLVNPNGVLFGAGSRVDVGGLVATSMNIANDDFMAGRDQFRREGALGKVINQGEIRAVGNGNGGGLVALLAPEAINEGVIVARLGSVVMAAGEQVTLESGAAGQLHVAVDPATVNALVENRHLVQADGGQVLMSAQAADTLLSAVVANSGTVRARTLAHREGRIVLLADMAQGEVRLAGVLDASAPGDDQSSSSGGNGGFIETSAAKVGVGETARVTTAAANGETGLWLIDPNDYTIAASGGNITGAQLASNLAGTHITISTATQGTAGGNGDIFVNDTVSWSANKLTLSAGRDIRINRSLNASGSASLALEYGQLAPAAGNTADYYVNAPVNLPAGLNFSTKLGSDGATKTYTVITSLGAAGSTTGTDLQGIGGSLAGNYVLGADIDASATSGWNSGAGFVPIGNNGMTSFTGSLDGLGHTIRNLSINRSTNPNYYVGLFGKAEGATLRNVGLVDGSVIGNSYVGALAGYVSNTTVKNSYAATTVNGNSYVGGLVGGVVDSSVVMSHATGNVTATGDNVGGLVGELKGFSSLANPQVSNSYATGNVSARSRVGGLVGYQMDSSVSNSYALGNVTGNASIDVVGGLIGSSETMGFGPSATVRTSYATGRVTGAEVGGLIGSASGVTVENSYWNTTTSGQSTSAGGVGKTTAEMKQQASFSGFDFGTGWRIYDGLSTPVLRAIQRDLTVTANSASKTYDGSAYSGGNGVVYSVPGATLAGAVGYSGTSQGALNAGTYAITPSLTLTQQDYQNWHVTAVDGTLTINPAALTAIVGSLTGTVAKTYDGTSIAMLTPANFVLSGWVGADGASVSKSTGSYADANAGSGKLVTVSLATGDYLALGSTNLSNYSLPTVISGNVGVINKANAMVTANSASVTYNGALQSVSGYTVSGLVGSDTSAVLSGLAASGGSGTNAGSYAHTLGVGSYNGNYALSFTPGTLTINKANATVTANSANVTYNGALQSVSGYTVSGLVGSDSSAVLSGLAASGGSGTNAGSYAHTLGVGSYTGNYALSFTPGTLTINKANATVTANSASMTYNGALQSVSGFTVSGLVGSDTSAVLSGLAASGGSGTNAGSYAHTLGVGSYNGNYALSFTPGALTINKANATVTANSASVTYNGALQSVSGFTVSGLVGSDGSAVLSGLTSSGGSGTDIGSYAHTLGVGSYSGNYTLSFVAGMLTIGSSATTVPSSPLVIATTAIDAVVRVVTAASAPIASTQTSSLISGAIGGAVSGGIGGGFSGGLGGGFAPSGSDKTTGVLYNPTTKSLSFVPATFSDSESSVATLKRNGN